jgi:hypothetical protein
MASLEHLITQLVQVQFELKGIDAGLARAVVRIRFRKPRAREHEYNAVRRLL